MLGDKAVGVTDHRWLCGVLFGMLGSAGGDPRKEAVTAAVVPVQAGTACDRSRWAPKAAPRESDGIQAGSLAGVGSGTSGGFCG